MEQLLAVGVQVGALFFYVFLGLLGRRLGILNSQGDRAISDLIFYFTMPALTVTSMNLEVSDRELASAFLVLGAAVVLVLVSYALSVLVVSRLHLPMKPDYAFRMTVAFGNVAYLGFPVAYILWGRLGVFYAAMYALGHNILFWTLGVWLMQDHREHGSPDWAQLFNINFLAIILGLALALGHYRMPSFIFRTLDNLGQATIPLAMIMVGSMLAESSWRALAGQRIVYLMVAIRLIFLPLVALAAMTLVPGWDRTVRMLIIMQMAMPAAAIAPTVARKYDGDYSLISTGVIATTMVSLLTIPLWAWLLNYQIMT